MSAREATIIRLAGADAAALIQQLIQLRWEASARPPRAAPGLQSWKATGWDGDPPMRAAIVADSCERVANRAELLQRRLERAQGDLPVLGAGAVAARRGAISSIGLLFPGQGSPALSRLGALGRYLPDAQAEHRAIALPPDGLPKELTQLAIVASSLAVMRALESLGVEARFGIGHSLGELTALHWAGAFDRTALIEITRLRGRVMTQARAGEGAMAAVLTSEDELPSLLSEENAVIACFNAPGQYVVSGERAAVEAVCARARGRGIHARRLAVTGAFHSRLMAPAARAFGREIAAHAIGPLRRPVLSTVTGDWLYPGEDVRALLVRQIESPVLFRQALAHAAAADLLIEAGPGKVLSGLVREQTDTPVVSLPAEGGELDFLQGLAALWVCGAIGPRAM